MAFELAYCCFFIVETKGLSLEQTAALFDGGHKPSAGHADQPDVSSEAETGSFVHVSKELPRNEDGSETNSLTHSYATDTTVVVEAIKPAA